MLRFHSLPIALQEKFQNGTVLKVIAGLDNFDKTSVAKISAAAGLGGADLIDLACDPELVQLSLSISPVPVCVSSVEPELFPSAIEAGASIAEIGNFDTFYPKGRFFDAKEVLDLTIRSKKLLKNIPLSVTVPHVLPLHQQSQLALDLVDAGADFIQTEGGFVSNAIQPGVAGLIEKAVSTLAATHAISKSFAEIDCDVPLIAASGLSEVTVSMALASGASAVGVGSVINRLSDQLEMIAMVRSLREAINASKIIMQKNV